ncbi:hypothetical protein MNBD_ALPHA11-432 [hydrothermal vent metagenome]|uniref:DUF3108 domain-containing protein n=1 Tax=hydrothermal vent metagenome TaxID=652676 RepID=A0A3B0U733_9ZZZZ
MRYFTILFSCIWSFGALAAPVSVVAQYVISVGGTIIARADIDLRDDGSAYTMDMSAKISGLGNLVASGSAAINVSGTSTNTTLYGDDFTLQTQSPQGSAKVTVSYIERNVAAFFSEPPQPPRLDQIPLQRSQLRNVNDMLSAFIIKSSHLSPQICDRTLNIFTGVERFDLKLSYAAAENATSARTGYQGPVILCQLNYLPISGHYASSEITNYLQGSERILIWYAPVAGSDIFIPYRVLIGTTFGDLSMVLTGLNK